VAREFYKDYNAAFVAQYKKTTGKDVKIDQSHGGSSAQARAEGEFLMLCPDGLHTPDHHHFDLHDPTTGQDVGVLWYALRHEGHRTSAFVYEIEIHAPYRRRGYATQAFTLLEQDAAARGATNIQLHVFGHNTGARALYTGLGFHETSIIMRKDLS